MTSPVSLDSVDQTLPSIPSDQFRFAMRHLAGGVSVITVGRGPDRTGFTATSVSSLAIDPPTVIVSLNKASSSWPVVARHGAFGVNILSDRQSHVADRFAGRGGIKGLARYEQAIWGTAHTGTLLLEGALVALDCELDDVIERHSHALLVGRVIEAKVDTARPPLVYWKSGYQGLSPLHSRGEDA